MVWLVSKNRLENLQPGQQTEPLAKFWDQDTNRFYDVTIVRGENAKAKTNYMRIQLNGVQKTLDGGPEPRMEVVLFNFPGGRERLKHSPSGHWAQLKNEPWEEFLARAPQVLEVHLSVSKGGRDLPPAHQSKAGAPKRRQAHQNESWMLRTFCEEPTAMVRPPVPPQLTTEAASLRPDRRTPIDEKALFEELTQEFLDRHQKQLPDHTATITRMLTLRNLGLDGVDALIRENRRLKEDHKRMMAEISALQSQPRHPGDYDSPQERDAVMQAIVVWNQRRVIPNEPTHLVPLLLMAENYHIPELAEQCQNTICFEDDIVMMRAHLLALSRKRRLPRTAKQCVNTLIQKISSKQPREIAETFKMLVLS